VSACCHLEQLSQDKLSNYLIAHIPVQVIEFSGFSSWFTNLSVKVVEI
jgi:hypothetical protein